jgi:acid phosphatase class B
MITDRLTYTVEDYEKGKKWALTQPHPFIKNKTLWEHVYDRRESTYTLSNLNNYLFNET